MRANGLMLLFCSLIAVMAYAQYQPAECPLPTAWSKLVTPENARPEYPRPLLQRDRWLNLNGLWQYAIRPLEQPQPADFDGMILVPFPLESALSGVGKSIDENQQLWYRRTFTVPKPWTGMRLLLHFEASDWRTQVYLNGRYVGEHKGGYDPFTFDISDYLQGEEEELIVAVWDPTDRGTQPRGKQVQKPGGIFYTAVSGLWGTVWLEPVPDTFIRDLRITSDIEKGTVSLSADCYGLDQKDVLAAIIHAENKKVAQGKGRADQPLRIQIKKPVLWQPDRPFLYDLEVRLLRKGKEVDVVRSYFGMRKIAIGADEKGITRLLLNQQYIFHKGPLDQGFWPDGIYTAPTEEAMVYDLQVLKKMGFNMLRKHVKVEPRRFYYWCDRLGLMVWQDMPSGDHYIKTDEEDFQRTPESAQQFYLELGRMIESLYNHPSIVMWVPFNEGWGQFNTAEVVDFIRKKDATRLINPASGWCDRGVGDVVDWHKYPGPAAPPPEKNRAAVLGEFGGLGLKVEGHTWTEKHWGYQKMADFDELNKKYHQLWEKVWQLEADGLSAAVYTQTTDVETETNGLMTYDRAVIKIDTTQARKWHRSE